MDIESLLEIRKKIVQNAQELAMNGAGDANSRLSVLMELIRGGAADTGVYSAAFELINKKEGDDSRLDGYLDLLYEVDQAIAKADIGQPGIDGPLVDTQNTR